MNKRLPISLLILAFAGGAIAQQALPSFEEVDQNGDGAISEQEAQAVEGLDFASADTNQDGQLDRIEYAEVSEQ